MKKQGEHVIWFTGLSGSGKTTIARYLAMELRKRNKPFILLDGDEVRKTLSIDLGYKKCERKKHIVRVACMCYLISANQVLSIACVLSPTRSIRRYARSLIGTKFIEVYVKCSVEECEERDVKGHWSKARSGNIKDFVGINIPYDVPFFPEIVLDTENETVYESTTKLINYLEKRKII